MITRYFDSIHFAWPWAFGLFLLLPLLAWWYLKKQKSHLGTLLISRAYTPSKNAGGWRVRLVHLPFLLRLLTLSCIILAIARPQTRFDEEQTSGEGVDIILCIDVSGSMLAQDFTPNRLEAAKEVAANFVNYRRTDRFGVVIFSGESFTICPLTTDRNVLKSQIYGIQSGFLEDGTAIGSGLATSCDRLRLSQSKSKVIVLLTDGENNGGQIPPGTAREIARSLGIRVYTIGVGTEGYAPIPVRADDGSVVMQREKVNIDEKLLTQIAQETGGQYFRAKDNEGLEKTYSEIDRLEKSIIDVTAVHRFTERFLPLVLAAIGFLFLEWVLRLTVLRKFP